MNPDVHLFESAVGWHALAVDGSRIYDLDEASTQALLGAVSDRQTTATLLSSLGIQRAQPYIDAAPIDPPPVRGLSLAVSSTCNLACSYCYAQQGTFGGSSKPMPWSVAMQAIDRLLDGAEAGGSVNIAFLGGEPLINRPLVREATRYALERGAIRGVAPRFSITSNGTLIERSDAEFFDTYGFSVTVSLDGIGAAHDRQRPFRGGGGSYDRILECLAFLLERQRRMQVSARVTVTPHSDDLVSTLDRFSRAGFHSVGFAPVLASPGGRDELEPTHLVRVLDEMIACGHEFERRVSAGDRYPFSNMESAMRQLHRGTHRPYPCGAGAGYLGVSSDGGLFACHRFVGDSRAALGGVSSGPDEARRTIWLTERHVDRQDPCGQCWARYLCGGGCHHEVINRGRPACDFIRGWLQYCLQAYVQLLERRPEYFGEPRTAACAPA
jgi:uncharacterized protein